MTTISEHQWVARRALVCRGEEEHLAPFPHLREAYGVSGPVECAECGSRMDIVHILTAVAEATWSDVADAPSAPLYTTAKLDPVRMLQHLAAERETGSEALTDPQRRLLFARFNELGYSEDDRHDLLEDVTGKRSMTEITSHEVDAILNRLDLKAAGHEDV